LCSDRPTINFVVMAVIGEEIGWLSSTAALAQSKVGRQLSSLVQSCNRQQVHPEGRSVGSKTGDVPDEPRQWTAFEYADLMEQGLSGGIAHSFMSVPTKDEEVRLCVKRSPDRKEFLLTTEDGANLLLARRNDNNAGYRIYVAGEGDPPSALGPAFSLMPNATADRWTLDATVCDQCEGRGKRLCGSRGLAKINHFIVAAGRDDQGKILCMDVEIPAVSKHGDADVWCPMCKGSQVNSQQKSLELVTRRPKWNARRKSLSLDFFGRCNLASARNFQLAVSGKPDKVTLLFGKVGTDQFVMDFKRPLSTVQAFAAAVSTSVWK